MTRFHSSNTEISVAGTSLTTFTNTSTFTRGFRTGDVTCYGDDDEVHDVALKYGSYTMGGVYHTKATANSPKSVMEAVAALVSIIRKPEGTGSGKPTETFNAALEQYVESAPVADFITWSAEFKVSGAVTLTTQ